MPLRVDFLLLMCSAAPGTILPILDDLGSVLDGWEACTHSIDACARVDTASGMVITHYRLQVACLVSFA